ncbi:hypothetical protein E3J38_05415, partial [candidate division TA06 bacterium]
MKMRHSFVTTGALLGVFAAVGFLIGLTIASNLNLAPEAKAQANVRASAVELQNMFGEAANAVMPSVVNISAEKVISRKLPFRFKFWDRDFDELFKNPPGERKVASLGSGVIVDSRGYILTNNHVIDGADKFVVTLHDCTEY